MGKLSAALAWAARGFRVFPLQVGSKDPIGGLSWTVAATADLAEVQRMWTDPVTGHELDNNIGFLTTGWVVADVDVKNGTCGLDTFADLGLDFDTLTTRTASGGYHLVYRGSAGQSPLGKGIDVRSHNGYVVAPGSIVAGHQYAVELDLPVLDFPERLRHLLRQPRERALVQVSAIELDLPENIELAAYYLRRQAPHGEQGGRNWTCYCVACRIRDYGVSEETARELIVEHWNEFCEPPLDLDEITLTTANAFRYAAGEPGALAPAAIFSEVKPIQQERAAAPIISGRYNFGNLIAMEDIETRPWIADDLLMQSVVTTLIGAGGTGKSVLILTIAAHLAVGKPFLGHEILRPGRSIVYNAEDDLKEMSRRMHAICEQYELDKAVVQKSVALVSSDDFMLRVADKEGRVLKINEERVAELIAAAAQDDVQMVALDPLVEIHGAEENDSTEMAYVMSVLRLVAREAKVGVLVGGHTGKPPVAASNSWAGSQHAGRGSSSVPAAARIVLTLFGAAESDCAEIGIAPAERHRYVRLDGAKGQFSAGRNKPLWLRWPGREIASGDEVGVLVEHDARAAYDSVARSIGQCLYDGVIADGSACLSLERAVELLRSAGLLMEREENLAAKRRIVRLLTDGVHLESGARVKIAENQVVVS